MLNHINKQTGFTLLETLVAFSIFTISLGVLLQIYSKGTQAAGNGNHYAMATIIAQSKLAGITHLKDIEAGVNEGNENNIYQWTTTIEPYEDDQISLKKNHGLSKYKVKVAVLWGNTRKKHSVTLTTLKLIPTNDI